MQENGRLTKIKVFHFDPTVDKEPRYESYEVPYVGYTVLGTLEYIYKELDPSLSYRTGCLGKGSGRCGACPVMVNGRPALSCQVMAEPEMTVEPHPKFEIIKDLVVDNKQVKSSWVHPNETIRITVDKDKCVACKDCTHICPVQVYAMDEVDGRPVAKPVDVTSCCGVTCKMCETHCSHGAITVESMA